MPPTASSGFRRTEIRLLSSGRACRGVWSAWLSHDRDHRFRRTPFSSSPSGSRSPCWRPSSRSGSPFRLRRSSCSRPPLLSDLRPRVYARGAGRLRRSGTDRQHRLPERQEVAPRDRARPSARPDRAAGGDRGDAGGGTPALERTYVHRLERAEGSGSDSARRVRRARRSTGRRSRPRDRLRGRPPVGRQAGNARSERRQSSRDPDARTGHVSLAALRRALA
jgi:hypothetical protein